MGEIVGAGILAHSPTIMLPDDIRIGLNDGKESTLYSGLFDLKRKVLDELKPDTVIVIDTHWGTIVEFIVTSHARRKGKYTSEELPRGMCQVPYDLKGNPQLAGAIAERCSANGVRTSVSDDPCLPIQYPTVNLAHFLRDKNRDEEWLSLSVCQTGDADDCRRAGLGLKEAVEASGRRAVIMASGGLSHTFWPLKELGKHEAADPVHIRTPQHRAADETRIEQLLDGDHAAVIRAMPEYHQFKPEAGFRHYLIMAATLGGEDCKAPGRKYSEYENSTGTGQIHIWFDRPAAGWN
ncbi:MAG: DODA-type extradiol aromatic ring-opening family dioxygenase [Rhodospirillales bacterium]